MHHARSQSRVEQVPPLPRANLKLATGTISRGRGYQLYLVHVEPRTRLTQNLELEFGFRSIPLQSDSYNIKNWAHLRAGVLAR